MKDSFEMLETKSLKNNLLVLHNGYKYWKYRTNNSKYNLCMSEWKKKKKNEKEK